MPSAKVLESKKAVVEGLKERLGSSVAGVLVDYKGINVEQDTKLRKDFREANVKYDVVKNTLLRLAVNDTAYADLAAVLEGTTAIATSKDDYIAAAKILNKYAEKSDSFSIKSGYLDGEVISLEKINSLAKLPSREVLLATVLNAFNAPIAAFARAVQAIVDKNGEAAPAAE